MVDAEPLIITKLETAIKEKFPKALVTGEKVSAPSEFPAVSIVEVDSSTYERSLTGEPIEHHSNIYYEVEIFSNLSIGRKTQCRQIAKVIDDEMIALNFTRRMLAPIPNVSPSIYRMVGRYAGVVSNDYVMYRR